MAPAGRTLRGTTRSVRIWAANDYGSSDSSTSNAVTVPWLVTFDKVSEDATGNVIANMEAADDGSITITENKHLYAVWFSQSHEMTSFVFEASENSVLSTDAVGVISGTDIYVTLPAGTDLTNLTLTVTHTGRGCRMKTYLISTRISPTR